MAHGLTVAKAAGDAKGLVSSVAALLDLPGFVESEELMDSLETITDETKRVVELLPAALAAG